MNQPTPTPVTTVGVFPLGFPPTAASLHSGIDELPFVTFADGVELQILHVDLNAGLWINRTRLRPGTTVPTHYHTGMVLAVTLQGSWYYLESPDHVNRPGSYLFEPPGSVHTLHAPASGSSPAVAWFAIWGANIDVDAEGGVHRVLDAYTMLSIYRRLCAVQGLDCSKTIVLGEG